MIEIIRDNIERGLYPLDKRLPSERKLSEEFKVPQSQIRKALQTLVEEGYLDCLRNNGYFVRKHHPVSKKLHQVAFCMESEPNVFSHEDFYTGLLFNYAVSYDLNLVVYKLPTDAEGQNRMLLELMERKFAGIICFPHVFQGMVPALLETKKRGIPLIFWDYSPFHSVFPSVGVDHFLSCFTAAGTMAANRELVTYIGFEGKEQNELKYQGFLAGCSAFGLQMEEPVLIPYEYHVDSNRIHSYLCELSPGRLYFTSTRLLTETLVGAMMDRGYMPGRDYRMLGTDMLKLMEGSSLQLDCMMRDRETIIRSLLTMMKDLIEKTLPISCDYRIAMKYIPGKTLR